MARKTPSNQPQVFVQLVEGEPHPLSVTTLQNGRWHVNHPNLETVKLICEALGTSDFKFATSLLNMFCHLALNDANSEGAFDFLISAIKGIAPRDEVEAMLAAQMAAVHLVGMRFSRLMLAAKDPRGMEIYERGLNRAMRTYSQQMEALKRYRSKGEHKIVVQHVNVGEGGQAIVGDVHQQKSLDAKTAATAGPPLQLVRSNDRPMEPIGELPKSFLDRKAEGAQ
jgi:hypothetical protein